VRRLFRAEAAGKITFGRIVVIDRDPSCAVAGLVSERVQLETAAWDDWLADNLSRCGMGDHLVPYHWAPHVLLDWLAADLKRHGLFLVRRPDPTDPPVRPPMLRETKAGDAALSYAEWLCPPACIEPALCPHTRGPKSWSLATELGRAPHSFVFPCLHLAQGVATIPLSAIFGARDHVVEALRRGELGPESPAWISSASHCHGLAAKVTFPRAAPPSWT
jgi:hypothetical protein